MVKNPRAKSLNNFQDCLRVFQTKTSIAAVDIFFHINRLFKPLTGYSYIGLGNYKTESSGVTPRRSFYSRERVGSNDDDVVLAMAANLSKPICLTLKSA